MNGNEGQADSFISFTVPFELSKVAIKSRPMVDVGNGQSWVKYSSTQSAVNLFTFSSQLSLYITSFWGFGRHPSQELQLHLKTQAENQRSTGLAEITKSLRQTSGLFHWCNQFYFSCIHSCVKWCIVLASCCLYVLAVNHFEYSPHSAFHLLFVTRAEILVE